MKWLMRKCTKCGRYTLKEACPLCGSSTRIPHPPKFSPEDKYARYRMEGSEQTGPVSRPLEGFDKGVGKAEASMLEKQ